MNIKADMFNLAKTHEITAEIFGEKTVKKNNPGMEKYPEKINALVFKEMYGTYRDKYNEFIGNLPKEELKRRQMEKNKFRWKDIDLVNKITAINKLTNTTIFDDFKQYNNEKKNESDLKTSNLQFYASFSKFSS